MATPVPPPELRLRVAGTDDADWFIKSGKQTVDAFGETLAILGRRYADFQDIYEFGCGCGRLMRWVRERAPRARLRGSDIDAQAITWMQTNLPEVKTFVNEGLPPLPMGDASADLVLCYSVFTHLDEKYQDAWLAELQRIARPGALLLVTVRGSKGRQTVIANLQQPELFDELKEKGFVFISEDDWAKVFPDFYHTTCHLPWYVRAHWSRWFIVLDVLEDMAQPDGDIVVLLRADAETWATVDSLQRSLLASLLPFAPNATVDVGIGDKRNAAKEHFTHRVKWISQEVPTSMQAGGEYRVRITLQNSGSAPWPSKTGKCGGNVQISYHWFSRSDNALVVLDGQRTPFPHDIQAGETFTADAVRVVAPEKPGSYCLQLTLVHEMVAWFEKQGATPLNVLVQVY